ncbi:MAG: cation-transporting P-type ATPase, partial [Actinomycetota bacterium]|nr:cation-transporting P-type ATPase [Actinomycetota bacterium]
AVETLGCADFICSDKTGTLTLNQMTVVEAFLADESPKPFEDFLTGEVRNSEAFHLSNLAAVLCNDSRETPDGSFVGDSTEVALLAAAKKAEVKKDELEERMPRLMEIPFDSDRKMMSTVHPYDNGYIVLTKGATEALLARSSGLQKGDKVEPLTNEKKTKILKTTEELGGRALRTIALAYRIIDALPAEADPSEIERGLVFLGAYAMKDPPRQEVFDALATCKRAKISVAMVTGDHLATAQAIGKELGILSEGKEFVDAIELEKMSDEELGERAENISVYARVSPRHKVKIVDALKSKGHVVAMTGDGVNDAPALKRADIGVAMGITGTDVSKEASDMVLMDDNFATIVTAVREGRTIFSNIKKFIYFLLSCNISEVLVMFIAMLAGFPLPLLPVQILWVNLVTDGLPALALGMDTPEADLMDRPPRKPGESILAYSRLRKLLWYGVTIAAGALLSFVLAHFVFNYPWENKGAEMARTIVFSTMVFTQLLHSLNFHSEERSFFTEPPWGNRYLVGALFASLLLQLAVIYVPFMQKAFHTCAPSLEGWLLIALCSLVPVLIIDRIKVISAKLARKKEGNRKTF